MDKPQVHIKWRDMTWDLPMPLRILGQISKLKNNFQVAKRGFMTS